MPKENPIQYCMLAKCDSLCVCVRCVCVCVSEFSLLVNFRFLIMLFTITQQNLLVSQRTMKEAQPALQSPLYLEPIICRTILNVFWSPVKDRPSSKVPVLFVRVQSYHEPLLVAGSAMQDVTCFAFSGLGSVISSPTCCSVQKALENGEVEPTTPASPTTPSTPAPPSAPPTPTSGQHCCLIFSCVYSPVSIMKLCVFHTFIEKAVAWITGINFCLFVSTLQTATPPTYPFCLFVCLKMYVFFVFEILKSWQF